MSWPPGLDWPKVKCLGVQSHIGPLIRFLQFHPKYPTISWWRLCRDANLYELVNSAASVGCHKRCRMWALWLYSSSKIVSLKRIRSSCNAQDITANHLFFSKFTLQNGTRAAQHVPSGYALELLITLGIQLVPGYPIVVFRDTSLFVDICIFEVLFQS